MTIVVWSENYVKSQSRVSGFHIKRRECEHSPQPPGPGPRYEAVRLIAANCYSFHENFTIAPVKLSKATPVTGLGGL
jgi:hypothetical protein